MKICELSFQKKSELRVYDHDDFVILYFEVENACIVCTSD